MNTKHHTTMDTKVRLNCSRHRIITSICVAFLLIVFGCDSLPERHSEKTVRVNFNESDPDNCVDSTKQNRQTLSVAISSMISPKETFRYYENLFRYIGRKVNAAIEFKQRKTYAEVNQMLRSGEVQFAFICSGAYIELANRSEAEILVVPVINGKPLYQAYIIAHRESGIKQFAEFKGKSFAFTDPLSNTGYLFARKLVNQLGETPHEFFKNTLFSYAHDNSIQLVVKRIVDGATIDGLIFDYLEHSSPERVKDLVVIERSEYYGIPPVVVPKGIPSELKEKLQDVFLHADSDPDGKKILDQLHVDRFIKGRDKDYDTIRRDRKIVQ